MAAGPLVVGYFRANDIHGRNYHVSDVPADKLTHLNYAFADVSAAGECVSLNQQDDEINFPALQVLGRQSPGLTLLVSVGGAAHSGNFSSSTSTAAKRQSCATSCVAYMKANGFGGIDIDWEFPSSADKTHYSAFLKELRSQLDTQGATDNKQYVLTAALPAGPENYANIQLDQVHQYLDWINLLAYDFYTAASKRTSFTAPLYKSSTDPEPDPKKRASYNVDAAVKAYLSSGVPAAKIVVGVPFVGQGWQGVADVNSGLYQPATGPAQGTWASDGVFDWKDLSTNYIATYQRFWNAEVSAPWLYDADAGVMISYDDPTSLATKAAYVAANSLGGVMIWPLSADDAQGSLVNSVYNALYPQKLAGQSGTPSSLEDLRAYSGILPYDAELFGVFRPLLNWYGYQAQNRVTHAEARAAAWTINSMVSDAKLIARGPAVEDPLSRVSLQLPDVLLSTVGSKIADAAADIVNATGKPPTQADWSRLLSPDQLGATLADALAAPALPALANQYPAIKGTALARPSPKADSPEAAKALTAQKEIATANFLAWAANHSPAMLNALFLTARPSWRTAINFIQPFGSPTGAGQLPSAVLSPVGLVNLYREYFYQFNTFLGPPVGHVWVSPGGTLEVFEVSTRKTTVEQVIEASTTETAKSETDITQQDEVSDAVKQDNKNDTKLAAGASGGVNYGVVHANASASFSSDSTRQTSSEEAHKHSRTQSAKLSKEITSNYKTTFRTVTETTDTVSRRYVLQNTTSQLVNYELRRKFRVIGVQLQHIGTRLCWQVYVPGANTPDASPSGLLSGAEFVPAPAASTASALKPPDPLEPQEKDVDVVFPLMPVLGTDTGSVDGGEGASDRTHRHDAAYGIAPQGQPDPDPFIPQREVLNSYGNSFHIHSICNYSASPPGAGYTLSAVRINKTDPDGIWAKAVVDDAGGDFHIQLGYAWWKGKDSIDFTLTLVWAPPSPGDPNYNTYNPAIDEYNKQLAAAQKQDFINATRNLVKTVSGITPRSSADLRAEERHAVFRQLYQQLTQIPMADQYITAEYIRELFDVDEMLYFVDPDYYLAKPAPPPASQLPTVAVPSFDPNDPLADATITSWPRRGFAQSRTNDYLITEDSQPAPLGESLGWTIQLDGDERRNEFLNAAWVKAVLPVHPGRELDALAWLMNENVEGENGLDNPYIPQPGDPPNYIGKTVRQVLNIMAGELAAQNTDIQNTLTTEVVFERGFDPLADGIKVDPRQDYKGDTAGPYQTFDFWLEVLPTDQVVAVNYDPTQHGA